MTDVKKKKYIGWLFFNIFLPLLPVLVKLCIVIFGNGINLKIELLDSSELLYYNFVICVLYLYGVIRKRFLRVIESLIAMFAFFIIVIDLVLLVIVYLRLQSSYALKIVSVILSILVPIVASYHEYQEVRSE